jgi:hypothetical protein
MPLLLSALYDGSLDHARRSSCRAAGQGDKTMQQQATGQETFDFPGIITRLNGLLRLKTTVIGILP